MYQKIWLIQYEILHESHCQLYAETRGATYLYFYPALLRDKTHFVILSLSSEAIIQAFYLPSETNSCYHTILSFQQT